MFCKKLGVDYCGMQVYARYAYVAEPCCAVPGSLRSKQERVICGQIERALAFEGVTCVVSAVGMKEQQKEQLRRSTQPRTVIVWGSSILATVSLFLLVPRTRKSLSFFLPRT